MQGERTTNIVSGNAPGSVSPTRPKEEVSRSQVRPVRPERRPAFHDEMGEIEQSQVFMVAAAYLYQVAPPDQKSVRSTVGLPYRRNYLCDLTGSRSY
jgi:hypothetical protein